MICFLGLRHQPTVEVLSLFRSVLFQVVQFPLYGPPHNWWRPVCKNKVSELKRKKLRLLKRLKEKKDWSLSNMRINFNYACVVLQK